MEIYLNNQSEYNFYKAYAYTIINGNRQLSVSDWYVYVKPRPKTVKKFKAEI